jgi:hypothetical protein
VNTLTKGTAKVGKLKAANIDTMSVAFTVGTEATNAINVAMQFYDGAGKELTERKAVHWWLASNAAGDTIASAPSSGIAIGTDGTLIESVNNVSGILITEADGDADVTLTDNTTGTWYLVIKLPSGSLAVSSAITFA